MYKIFMLIAIPVIAVAWIVYALWERKMRIEEKKQPKQVSERLQKTRSEMTDWAQKMAQFKKPTHKPDQSENNKS
jgi:amino acid permease